jgi:hypothetical protein
MHSTLVTSHQTAISVYEKGNVLMTITNISVISLPNREERIYVLFRKGTGPKFIALDLGGGKFLKLRRCSDLENCP